MGLVMHVTLGVLITNCFLGAKAATCPSGWLHKQGNCYGYFQEELTWNQADAECQSYSPRCHLASLLNRLESKTVAEFIKKQQGSPKEVWIGLSDTTGKRQWIWADCSTSNYSAWGKGEPNNVDQEEDCVELTSDTSFKKWNDKDCDLLNAYICKYHV